MSAVHPAISSHCACGNLRPYADCCGRFHSGEIADTPQQLMRARYGAFVLRLTDFLLASWHPDTRPETLELPDSEQLRWLGLDIRSKQLGASGKRARVEFIARYRENGGPVQMRHEISRFVREDGRWYYVDSEFPRPPAPFPDRR